MTPLNLSAAALVVAVLTLVITLISLARMRRRWHRPRVPLTAERIVATVAWVEAEEHKRRTQPRVSGKFATRKK